MRCKAARGAGAEEVAQLSKKELLSMLRFGADRIFAAAEGRPPSDQELDSIIDRSAHHASVSVPDRPPPGDGRFQPGSSQSCSTIQGGALLFWQLRSARAGKFLSVCKLREPGESGTQAMTSACEP